MFKIRILKPEFDTTSLCLQDSKFLRLFVMKTCFLLPRMRFSFILLLFVRKLLENVQLQLMFKLPLDIYFVKVPYSHNGCPCRTTNNYINQHQPTCTPQRFHLAGIRHLSCLIFVAVNLHDMSLVASFRKPGGIHEMDQSCPAGVYVR